MKGLDVLTALEIFRRRVAFRSTVYKVLKQFKPEGSKAGRIWSAAEDALLALKQAKASADVRELFVECRCVSGPAPRLV
jgi:hypothetical protein